MGQKNNTLTLRKKESLNNISLSPTQLFPFAEFLKNLIVHLKKKNMWILSYSLNSENKVKILNLKVYYTTRRIIKYKKKLINPKKVKIKKNKFKNNNSTLLLKLLMEKAKQHLIILKITPINFGINKRMAKEIFKGMWKFRNALFARRTHLFLDLLKLTQLFLRKKITLEAYLPIIGEVFKILPKRGHRNFFLFLKALLKLYITTNGTKVKGIKFVIAGRIKGKLRANVLKMEEGLINTQSFSSEIDFCKNHVYTMYGCFGFKVWINYFKI